MVYAVGFCIDVPKVYSTSASPVIHKLNQPNGDTFSARQWGNEYVHGWETRTGYSVVKKQHSDSWYYAQKSSDGSLKAGSREAHRPPPADHQKHLRPTNQSSHSIDSQKNTRDPSLPSSIGVVQPTKTGSVPNDVDVPVLLIDFNNTETTYTGGDMFQVFFADPFDKSLVSGPGNFRDYFQDVSYGNYTVDCGPACSSSQLPDWEEADNNHDYYGEGGNSETGVADTASELAREAIQDHDANFDYSEYDDDNDDEIYVLVVHQGAGGEASGQSTDIWSHAASFGPPIPNFDGVEIRGYAMVPEINPDKGTSGETITTIGVIAHEYGHFPLLLPDLYDVDGSSNGIGLWGLMGSGDSNSSPGGRNGDAPAWMSAWSRWALEWSDPTQVEGPLEDEEIEAVENIDDSYFGEENPNEVDWDWFESPGEGEYFLAENRQQIGFDTGLPGEGLLIWHIDETVSTVNSMANTNEDGSRLVDLEQADAQNDLDTTTNFNSGDAGDPFPGTSTNQSFTETSDPAAIFYDNTTSGFEITDISESGDTVTADFFVSGASENNKDDGGQICIIRRSGVSSKVLNILRWSRDSLLRVRLGRLFTTIYYQLSTYSYILL